MKELQSANNLLACAIEGLVNLETRPCEFAHSLTEAAGLLTTVRDRRAGSPRVYSQLRELEQRAQTAHALLESAAALRFGTVLQNGMVSQGYSPDGAMDQCGGRGIQIEA